MAWKKILLVEGSDDSYVLKHICGSRGLRHLDEIKQHGNVEQLVESLPVRLKESDIEALGVVVDADTDVAARWQSLRNNLLKAGFPQVPDAPAPDGTVLPAPSGTLLPRVGVWIMPDNQTTGILEDFLYFLVPQNSCLLTYARSAVDGIPETERRFKPSAKPKALIHTWLAWQESPGKPLGTAITARFLDATVPQVDVLVSWLNRLFFN